MAYRWATPIRYVKGLGPQRSRELAKIGIETVGDLLERRPLSYLYPGGVSIADAKEGNVIIKAKIKHIRRGWGSVVEAALDDGTGVCKAVWYHGAYLLQQLRPGMTVTFWGKYKSGVLQQPKWTTVDSSLRDVMGGQYGTHHVTIRAALKEVLANVELPDMVGGFNRTYCYQGFHFPSYPSVQKQALVKLKQDEALTLQLALAERRKGRESALAETAQFIEQDDNYDDCIMSYFSYDFTQDQNNAINTTIEDMLGETPMQRLIHGEVGSGKTAVAFYAAMLAALNGKRTLILCPTTILAQQHYDTLRGMGWDDVDLVCGTHPRTETGPCSWPSAHIVIGTHSLLNRMFLLERSSLVIIDEFQKFGVDQRAKATKHNPHLLLLSATPIPRTLAATVFGDLDVSVIKESPIKRGTVVTRWVLPEKREGMYEIIERELAKGHQAYVVYPRISGDEDVVSAERGFDELSKRFGYIGLLTGRASTADKARMLDQFRKGLVRVLVSTIIAEVGLDNPNATVMVIEGADRFGLSQLHQLRGRVCRSTDAAFCFLVSETSNPTSIARLEVIEKCNDGFEIAEHDLRLRGAGEVFSTRQTGLPDLKWCSLVDDYDLMIEAKELVASGGVGDGVKEMMRIRYGDRLEFGGVV